MTEQSLEDVLAKVENLRKDLSAESVAQKEELGFREGYHEFNSEGMDTYGIQVLRIIKPDTQKREVAKQQLQETYDSSDWYSARYNAGRALGIRDNEPKGRLNSWVSDLIKKLDAEIVVQEEIADYKPAVEAPDRADYISDDDYYTDVYSYANLSSNKTSIKIVKQPRIAHPDTSKRQQARKDLDRLRGELRKTYKNFNVGAEERIEAGKLLGYSGLRIRVHEFFFL